MRVAVLASGRGSNFQSIIDAYKEILPAIMKQTEDTSYFFKKEVPEPQNA